MKRICLLVLLISGVAMAGNRFEAASYRAADKTDRLTLTMVCEKNRCRPTPRDCVEFFGGHWWDLETAKYVSKNEPTEERTCVVCGLHQIKRPSQWEDAR